MKRKIRNGPFSFKHASILMTHEAFNLGQISSSSRLSTLEVCHAGLTRRIGCLTLQISFRKLATNCRGLVCGVSNVKTCKRVGGITNMNEMSEQAPHFSTILERSKGERDSLDLDGKVIRLRV